MKTTIIGFPGRFQSRSTTFRKEAVQTCNPRGEASFLLVRHHLEPCS